MSSFEKIEIELILFLENSIDPDIVLENFARIIRNTNYPQIWFEEFSDSKFYDLFLSICERSQRTIDLFAEDKMSRDSFLSRESLVQLKKDNFTSLTLKSFILELLFK